MRAGTHVKEYPRLHCVTVPFRPYYTIFYQMVRHGGFDGGGWVGEDIVHL